MEPERVPRSLVRKLESGMLPLQVLEGIGELRRYLDELEGKTLKDARVLGASPADMAKALGMTRQGVYHKLKRIDEAEERVVIPDLEPERG
jgi:hypothetical protein